MSYINLLTGKVVEEKKQKRKAPEAQVAKEIDAFLKSIGAYMRTIKSDGVKTAHGWRPSNQGRGISDRIGILPPNGRFIAIELKSKGKKSTTTPEQLDFLKRVIESGGIGCVADSISDVTAALNHTKQEMLEALPKPKTVLIGPDELPF